MPQLNNLCNAQIGATLPTPKMLSLLGFELLDTRVLLVTQLWTTPVSGKGESKHQK